MTSSGHHSLDDVFRKATVLSNATGIEVFTEERLATTTVEAVIALERMRTMVDLSIKDIR